MLGDSLLGRTDMPIPVTSADNFTGFQECTQAAPALYKPIIHD